jgi:hypothetical protein
MPSTTRCNVNFSSILKLPMLNAHLPPIFVSCAKLMHLSDMPLSILTTIQNHLLPVRFDLMVVLAQLYSSVPYYTIFPQSLSYHVPSSSVFPYYQCAPCNPTGITRAIIYQNTPKNKINSVFLIAHSPHKLVYMVQISTHRTFQK